MIVLELGLGRGEWVPFGSNAAVSCPTCAQRAVLTDHTIDQEGKVEPSLVCSNEACDFHDFVQLNGWTGALPRKRR